MKEMREPLEHPDQITQNRIAGNLVSIIIEWDNVRLSEMTRCRIMLRGLAEQMMAVEKAALADSMESGVQDAGEARRIEVLIAYNCDEIREDDIRRIVAEVVSQKMHVHWHYHGVEGADYYALKNAAGHEARGDILIFLDSDVIPDDGWLDALLGAFERPEVQVVCGPAYIEPENWYAKVVALFWFFPLRTEKKEIRVCKKFFANNVAFRNDVFLEHSFRGAPNTSRGACIELSSALHKVGIPVYCHTGAQVSHPPPNGIKHFISRAMAQGRDSVLRRKSAGAKTSALWLFTAKSFLSRLRAGTQSIIGNYRKVNLSIAGMCAGLLLMLIFYSLVFTGGVITLVFPSWIQRRFRL